MSWLEFAGLEARRRPFTGTLLATRSSVRASSAVAAAMRGLIEVSAEHGELLQGRHGDNVPAPHGVETNLLLELGRVVDLDAAL